MAISVESISEKLKELDNDHIIEFLGQMEVAEYIYNPWFLGAMVILAICCLIFKWRVLLATIIGLTGLAWLISYTSQQVAEVGEGVQGNSMVFFIGGGVVIVSLMLYLVFIKGD